MGLSPKSPIAIRELGLCLNFTVIQFLKAVMTNPASSTMSLCACSKKGIYYNGALRRRSNYAGRGSRNAFESSALSASPSPSANERQTHGALRLPDEIHFFFKRASSA
jgi:hypothetical protein